MAQFVVAGDNDSRLGAAVAHTYPEDHIKVWTGLYLVSAEATAQQVSERLGVTNGQIGRAVVTSINGYFGYAPKNVWEWLAVKGTPRHGS